MTTPAPDSVSPSNPKPPPLVAHIIYRLGMGGMENGLVNLINRIPPERYRHAIVCLKDSTDYSRRIRREDVRIVCLNRREGQDFGLFARLYRLLRELRPDIVHTRNLATVECQLPAFLAGVRHRVHGEHGWDVFDPDGTNRKYQWLRRAYQPLIPLYIPLSRQLQDYLETKVGVPARKIRRIINGVDTERFHPARGTRPAIAGCPFGRRDGLLLIGTIGRMHGVKDQTNLARAFAHLLAIRPEARDTVRLVMVGDGPLRQESREILRAAGLAELAWLPGEREDNAEILRGLDIFVLPSLAEGISNSILEAMATGLPVVATAVGGNPDLVADGLTGRLVEPARPERLAEALAEYWDERDRIRRHGEQGLRRVLAEFSLDTMASRYQAVYDELLNSKNRVPKGTP
jgi:sugar transferase (PEP-CTERM/EpsH1 system associated)